MPDLALGDEVAHRPRDLLDRDIAVDPVLIEEIDVVRAEPRERSLRDRADVPGAAIGAGPARFAEVAELGRDDDLVAHRLKRLADDLLVGVRTVGLGRIEEGDAEIVRLSQKRDRVGLLHHLAIGEVQAHAAEADRGDFEAALSEFALLHCPCSYGFACVPVFPDRLTGP